MVLPEELRDARALYSRRESDPFPESITALLRSVVSRYPDRDALRFIDGSPTLTYAQLERQTARIEEAQ